MLPNVSPRDVGCGVGNQGLSSKQDTIQRSTVSPFGLSANRSHPESSQSLTPNGNGSHTTRKMKCRAPTHTRRDTRQVLLQWVLMGNMASATTIRLEVLALPVYGFKLLTGLQLPYTVIFPGNKSTEEKSSEGEAMLIASSRSVTDRLSSIDRSLLDDVPKLEICEEN